MLVGERQGRPAAEQLIAAIADDVEMARYEDAPKKGHHKELLRLAAEARGLEIVKFRGGLIALDGQRAVFGTVGTNAPTTSDLAVKICRSKPTMLRLLRLAGVPVPEGRNFPRDGSDEAIEYAAGLGWPVVLKPSGERGGEGVVVGIRSDDGLRSAWQYTVRAYSGGGDRSVIVEREHDGVDVRVYVVAGEAVAGSVRLPAYVRGDGRSTIEALVEEANQERLDHPYLRRMPIVLDEETDRHLGSEGLMERSVPQRGRIVLLRRSGNIHLGGVSVDVTDGLPAGLVEVAVKAVAAIPGLDVAGVDFLVPNIGSANGAVVLEVNPGANICVAHFPVAGEPRDVAGAIVDQSLSVFS